MIKRFPENPLLTKNDIVPSRDDFAVECILNPGAFEFDGKKWLLMRIAERPPQQPGMMSFPIMSNGKVEVLEFSLDDPHLDATDPREIKYKGTGYITTMSHLRLASSTDGINFTVHNNKNISGFGIHENFGIEDCRVAKIEDCYYLTYTAVSDNGYGVGMITTKDWSEYKRHGIIISGPNKDCALFEEKINSKYYCLHRPGMTIVGGNYIWLAQSKDLEFWGRHQCIAKTRKGMWDSERIGSGAAPIKTREGWLQIYHGADHNHRYCLGALLLDLNDPAKVLARSVAPIMEPETEYEKDGFFGNVVFTNGHIIDGDEVTMYYGASDEYICGATFSINEVLDSLFS